jgi:hypothetical protein
MNGRIFFWSLTSALAGFLSDSIRSSSQAEKLLGLSGDSAPAYTESPWPPRFTEL